MTSIFRLLASRRRHARLLQAFHALLNRATTLVDFGLLCSGRAPLALAMLMAQLWRQSSLDSRD